MFVSSLAFLLLFMPVRLICPAFFLIFSFPEPEAQCGDDHRCCKADNAHQHIAARVLPQQHRAEHAPCGGLSLHCKCVRRLHQRRAQQHTRGTQSIDAAPLPPASVFPHPLLDECDPFCGIVHFA